MKTEQEIRSPALLELMILELQAELKLARQQEHRQRQENEPPPPESTAAWAERQGGHPQYLGGLEIFGTGATRSGIVRREPSSHPFTRLKVQIDYWRMRLEQTEKDFTALKNALSGGPAWKWPERQYGPPPEPKHDGLVALKHLQSVVLSQRKTLQTLKDELAATPEEQERMAREQGVEEGLRLRQSRVADVESQARRVTI